MGLCQENEKRWPEEPNPDWEVVNCKLLIYGTVSREWPEEPNPDWEVVNCKLLNYGTVSGE